MAEPNLLAGNRYRVNRSNGGTPETFSFFCIIRSKTLTQTNEFEDATVADCEQPLSIPNRKSILRARSWGGRFAGIVDAQRIGFLQADFLREFPWRYQFQLDPVQGTAGGAGVYVGPVFIENLEMGSENGGLTNFTAQFRGDGPLTWIASA